MLTDVTVHANVAPPPLTAEDRLAMKTLQTEKGQTVDRVIVETPARPCKWRILFDLVQIVILLWLREKAER